MAPPTLGWSLGTDEKIRGSLPIGASYQGLHALSSGIDADGAIEEGTFAEKPEQNSPIWMKIWEIYVLSERHLQVSNRSKLFEST